MTQYGLHQGISVLPYGGRWPDISTSAFIAPSATVIGDVAIGSKTGIWFHCVLRGDVNTISIGEHSNLQDGTIVHVNRERSGQTRIGDFVTVGHKALIHGCTIESGAFVGMGATVMDNVVVEQESMVAAGALVTSGKRISRGELWAGSPARYLRNLTSDEIVNNRETAVHYGKLASEYREMLSSQGLSQSFHEERVE